jgi:hypothetical protein
MKCGLRGARSTKKARQARNIVNGLTALVELSGLLGQTEAQLFPQGLSEEFARPDRSNRLQRIELRVTNSA